ncbi:YitT family protein [Saccharicrinis fermentans]|uniref:Putative BCR n=1 Tax=Saccharicrinis fermentans DSM 9555 = JCM 21142 TaxID=869213 RepID=W7Y5B3_9BACT|nr:YitT family protein [Saccharicrinis fermentans]GAF02748.1 putative BCR [Saccharicrinis fermentans DSM 9555 = JCM 21142]
MEKQKIYREVKSYLMLTLSLCIASIGWSAFIIPAGIVGGGITGLASTFHFLWGWDVGLVSISINAILIILAIKMLGFSFGIKSIYCIILFGILLSVLTRYFKTPLTEDTFMSTLIGSSLAGTGGGLIFINGGSTGGTDIIAMIINKYKNISLGRLLLLCDVFIIFTGYFVFQNIEIVMYGFITMAIFGYAVDLVITGNKQTVQLFIISEKYKRIADSIIAKTEKGCTILDGIGAYTGDEKKVLMVISKKRTSTILFRIIKDIDPDAFVTMGTVSGVYGRGFDQLKV